MLNQSKNVKRILEKETNDECSSVKTIVLEAIELDAGDRDKFLETACGNDDQLNRQVRELLSIHDSNQPSMLDQDFGRILVNELHAEDSPTVFGEDSTGAKRSFSLGRQLGSGSFGRVFLARQTAPVEREVAVKLLHEEGLAKSAEERFFAEHRAQAIMNHPNIANMLDAGKTERGQPFLVIEYVAGCSITEYCERHGLSFHQRLGIFTDVCRAVQHAHQKGVIHRDLKPSNVLVTVIDGQPVPKVIDFGVAKILRPTGPGQRLTEQGQFVGSLVYMSPEQARADNDIDTSSDVYGLGVLLYQLLTGRLPFGFENDQPLSPLATLKQICETPPPSPVSAFDRHQDQVDEGGQSVAEEDTRDDRRLRAALKEDLGWIIMKCLEKKRTRRYASVGNLIDDISNFLSNRPVAAAATSKSYLMRKFVSRNKRAIAICSMILLSGVLGVVGVVSAAQARNRIAKQQLIAAHERELGATAALIAEETKLILGRLATVAYLLQDPQSRSVLIAALDLTAKRLSQEQVHAENTLVKSKLHRVLGLTYAGVEDYLSAQEHLIASMEIEEQEGRTGPFYRSNKIALAQVFKGDQMLGKSEALALEVLEFQKNADSPDPYQMIDSLVLISKLHSARGQHLKALEMCNQMNKFAEGTPALSPDLKAKIAYQTAHTLFQLKRFKKAKVKVDELNSIQGISKVLFELRKVRYNYIAAKTNLACGDLKTALKLTEQAFGWNGMPVLANVRLIELKGLLLLQKSRFGDARELIEYGLRLRAVQWKEEEEMKEEVVLKRLKDACDQQKFTDADFNELRDKVLAKTIPDDDHLALIVLPDARGQVHY